MTITLPAPKLPAGVRSALVIATGAYGSPRLGALRAPAQDAGDVATVLGDPQLGGFTVTELRDRDVHDLRLRVDDFLAGRDADEMVLVYVSCHGVLSARRQLYFAAADTDPDRLASTGIDARWLIECLDECRARRQVVVLDCCFSGAFTLTKGVKGPADLELGELFGQAAESRGRVVLTASRATEYSFEGEVLTAEGAATSVFTAALLEGLRTGAADADKDGFVSVSEAYVYAYARVRESGGPQTPQRWLYGGEGTDVILTRSPAGIMIEPAVLDDEVRAGLDSRFPRVRIGAIETLAEWLTDPDPARMAAARAALAEIAEHDIPLVATAARTHLYQHNFQEMKLVGVRVEMPENSPIVLLKEMRGDRYLAIWIGAVEATAIAFAQQGMVSLRPLTHDLFCEVLDAVGVRLSSTSITALTDGIFYSDLYFSNGKAVSARSSDAIALAIRTGATILVASEILAEIGARIPDDADSAEDASGPPTGARDSGKLYREDNVTDRAARNVSIPAPRVYETKQLEVVGVRVEMPSNSPIVLLKEMEGDRYLPIWIGAVEATAIAFAQQGMVSLRPLTHDLLCEVLDTLGVRLSSATITSLTDGVFYTDLNLSNGRTVSARPSDGIALAMRARAPILVTTQILDEVGVEIPEHTKESSTELKQ